MVDDDEPIEECEEGLPPWLATFADLMSLLMCFFVLLLSFSEMDVQKYRRIAGSMKWSFGIQKKVKVEDRPRGTSVVKQEFSPGKPTRTIIKTVQQTTVDERPNLERQNRDEDEKQTSQSTKSSSESEKDKTSEAMQMAQSVLQQESKKGKVTVFKEGNRVIIRLKDGDTFDIGSDSLRKTFLPVIYKIGTVLKGLPGKVVVSGHTDNLPISNERFRSNWDLSAARAVSVTLALFRSHDDLDQSRFSIVGYADAVPLNPEDTPAARSENRRVEISIVIGKDKHRRTISAQDSAKPSSSENEDPNGLSEQDRAFIEEN